MSKSNDFFNKYIINTWTTENTSRGLQLQSISGCIPQIDRVKLPVNGLSSKKKEGANNV